MNLSLFSQSFAESKTRPTVRLVPILYLCATLLVGCSSGGGDTFPTGDGGGSTGSSGGTDTGNGTTGTSSGGGSTGTGDNTDGGSPPVNGIDPALVSDAMSQTCSVNGAVAQYWDYSLGVLRGDYPLESTLPPATFGGIFLHPRLGMTFIYPAGWNATAIIDSVTPTNEPAEVIPGNLSVLAGVSVLRSDARALWRYLFTTEPFSHTTRERLVFEVQQLLNGFGITSVPNEICFVEGSGNVAGFPGVTAAVLLQVDDLTMHVVTSAAPVPLSGQNTGYVSASTVAPTAEFEWQVLNTFLPIHFQLIARGEGTPAQCGDGLDNDGTDGTDLDDPDCDSPDDPTE